jgi:hypothetical protein
MPVVTISASYGAGGSQVGPQLADRLGVAFLDRAIPTAVAERLTVPLSEAIAHDEAVRSVLERLLVRFAPAAQAFSGATPPPEILDERSYLKVTEDVIRERAASGDGAVILGRAAAVVLADVPGALHVRLDGPRERRIEQARRLAEVLAGELARALDLPVPELVLVELDPDLSRAEPDVEIQELAAASAGTNLGVDFLPGAVPFTPAAVQSVDPAFAADVVWFDALVTNVDRTPRNPNLLVWHGRTWLIDHGAALYRQHGDAPLANSARADFAHIADHVLLAAAGPLAAADARLAERAHEAVTRAAELVPDTWLGDDAAARREDLAAFLRARLQAPRAFVEEAERARA